MAIVVKLGDKNGKRQWMDSEGTVYPPDKIVFKPKTDTFEIEEFGDERDFGPTAKPSNPKDSIGVLKADMSVVPTPVLYGLSLAMLEGALKYGKFNYREVGVRASIYIAALKRHVDSWEEGENYDPDLEAIGVKVSHLDKAIACLVILRDAMIRGKLEDDRRPASPKGWLQGFNEEAKKMIEHYKAKGKEVIHYTEQKHPSGFKQ